MIQTQTRFFPRLLLSLALLVAGLKTGSAAESCPGNPDALGTARTLAVDVATTPRVGRKHFAQTLPLAPKEVVLTFDDGPSPGTTPHVLDALAHECVKATFFMLGRNAEAHPDLVRRVRAEGHVVAHHTYNHPILSRMTKERAEAEIDHGFASVERALYGEAHPAPVTPFFRFPGFASTPELMDWLNARGIVIFGADLWASDWNPMSPTEELRLVMERLEATGGGIILFHDTKAQTAAMLPAFLRELKRRGYQVVQAVPKERSEARSPDR